MRLGGNTPPAQAPPQVPAAPRWPPPLPLTSWLAPPPVLILLRATILFSSLFLP